MYEFIKGTIHFIGPEYIVVENNGIGYQMAAPNPFIYSKFLNQEITIYTYTYVREDILALYGFQSREEKTLFMKLLNVTGIGPKGALAILAAGEHQRLVQAIEKEDESFLTKFPGVGKKTARQIILDLKGKLPDILPDYFPNIFQNDPVKVPDTKHNELDEAVLALLTLGYSDREIKKITPVLKKEELTTEEYIKKGLQLLLRS